MIKTLTIRITDATIAGGRPAAVNDILTLEEGEALVIIGAGRAVRHAGEPLPEPVERAPVETASASPAAEHAVAAPKIERKPRAPRAGS
jgi:hypothetical protein